MLEHDSELASGLRPMPAAPSSSPPGIDLSGFAQKDTAAPAPLAHNSVTNEPGSIIALGAANSPNLAQQLDSSGSLATQLTAVESCQGFVSVPASYPIQPQTTSPVRKPYPVELVEPIVMVRGAGRVPNMIVIQMLP
jgi:hypothetical protein